MNSRQSLALALDPAGGLRACGLTPDPWQRELLLAGDRQVLLCCSRQSGKSTTVAALTLHTALFATDALVLLLSPSLRQSVELFRKVLDSYRALGRPVAATYVTQQRLELANGSRIVGLPSREETLRGFAGVRLLVIDEAARVSDALYRGVRPMLAVSQGRLIVLSTPFGRQGWFWHEWQSDGPWKRVRVTWRDCPRIAPAFIEEERRALGAAWVAQEYECQFTAMEGLVYPNFMVCVVAAAPPRGQAVGGIDFGWRNPFAAVWGVLDRDDVLWLTGERYLRQTPLHEHATALRQLTRAMWYADPAGATERAELCAAGLAVRKGDNDIRLGIAAVSARLRTGRLKVVGAACPNLLAEAGLYRYPAAGEGEGENPVDADNHALAALRYLVSRLDARSMGRLRGRPRQADPPSPPEAADPWKPLV